MDAKEEHKEITVSAKEMKQKEITVSAKETYVYI